MSINVSPVQLREPGYLETLLHSTESAGLRPADITVELTEGLDSASEVTHDALTAIRSAGFGLAADDFGTGFASYAALQALPFSNVKIDKGVLDKVTFSQKSRAQVSSIVTMAHESGMTATAEGVETSEQLHALQGLGVNVLQGYYLSRPLGAEAAALYLRSNTQSAVL
jgi:EAL domain-containing protein (putative c-di-GMP-specific phosphodiesterase class I)